MKKILFWIFPLLLLTSCDRDFEFDTISVTQPGLEVTVETVTKVNDVNQYTKIAGATVFLYNNSTDFANQTNPLGQKVSDTNGKVLFTQSELGSKGVFYVRAIAGTLTGTGTTPYMLLNDGVTALFITLQ